MGNYNSLNTPNNFREVMEIIDECDENTKLRIYQECLKRLMERKVKNDN